MSLWPVLWRRDTHHFNSVWYGMIRYEVWWDLACIGWE